jgi:antitoxin YefM
MERVISYSRLRRELSRVLDQVNEDHAPIIITRRRGKPAVLMSYDDFSSYEESDYLLRSPKNARRMMESIRQADAGKARPHKLIRKIKRNANAI